MGFEYGGGVATACQLPCGGQPCRAASYDGYFLLSGAFRGLAGISDSRGGIISSVAMQCLDVDRTVNFSALAIALAGMGAYAAEDTC